jgi:NADH-quinone oxidoreductase subunit E
MRRAIVEMLSNEEVKEIEEAFERYPAKRNVCLEALSIVNRHRGWVSDDAITDIADLLEMSPDEVDAVSTFYSLIFRKAVGRHVILICDGVSCWLLDYKSIVAHLGKTLGIGFGETTPDRRFTLLPAPCLGACDHAPVMIVDTDFHGDLTLEKVDEILKAYE